MTNASGGASSGSSISNCTIESVCNTGSHLKLSETRQSSLPIRIRSPQYCYPVNLIKPDNPNQEIPAASHLCDFTVTCFLASVDGELLLCICKYIVGSTAWLGMTRIASHLLWWLALTPDWPFKGTVSVVARKKERCDGRSEESMYGI
jgi:hypothetical protein